jgi:peptide/nickel transport system substrate-binding protein
MNNERMGMRALLKRIAPLWLVIAALAVVVAGCGSGDDDGGSSGGGGTVPSGANIGEGKKGGDVTFLASGDVDFMDPGQSYYTFGFMVEYATNRPLYSFAPDDAETPVPDLAEGEPEISSDNKTITVKLKSGIKFSPPVDREVTSKDVKYAIERAFTSSVPSGYATSYFAEIEGAPEDAPIKINDLKPFSGLQTPDDRTLVIKLTKAVAPRVAAALVMPITIPVPEEYASKFDKKVPTDYNTHVAFTGPYMVKNDPKTGELTGWDIGKRMELVRNPNWDESTDYRPAYLDSITIQMGNDDATVANRRTLTGAKLMCCDSGQPPPSILARALRQYKDQLGQVPSGGTRWVALNTAKPPFDNIDVRKAAIAATDRNALRLTRGGEAVGAIAQSWLPPGLPGHEESNGEAGWTEFDWMQAPEGDLELAKKYLKAAADEGAIELNGEGLVDGMEITMVGDNVDPGQQTSQVAQTELEKLGFKVRLTKVPRDTMYTKFCGVPKNQPNVCPTVGWFKDFTDPESMLEPTFDGKAIKPAGNVNWSQLDEKEINDAMAEAALLQGQERYEAWAEVNKLVTAQAPGIPYIWDTSYQLASPDVNGVMSAYSTTWDLSFSSLK